MLDNKYHDKLLYVAGLPTTFLLVKKGGNDCTNNNPQQQEGFNEEIMAYDDSHHSIQFNHTSVVLMSLYTLNVGGGAPSTSPKA